MLPLVFIMEIYGYSVTCKKTQISARLLIFHFYGTYRYDNFCCRDIQILKLRCID